MRPIPLTFAGLGLGLPEREVSNQELAQGLDTSDEWISERTGIKVRRILESDKALSDLAVPAGREALRQSGLTPEQIGMVIVATVTPDTFMPATACRVASALQCHSAGAFDLNIACSGFLYGLLTAVSQMESQSIENVLLVGGDTLSRIVNWEDRRTAVLFGDSAGAAVLTRQGPGRLLGFDYGAEGRSADALMIKAGPSSPSTDHTDYKVTMDGRAVFRFAATILVESARRTLAQASVRVDEIDLIIPHQANLRILEAAAKKLEVSMDKIFVNLDRYGNTSAGSIPVALTEAYRAGLIKEGSKVLMAGFGGGLSWATVLLQWSGPGSN